MSTEMKVQHTPGPWRLDGQNIIAHEAEIGVAKVYGNIGQPTYANARLIAAAPDLLAACKDFVLWADATEHRPEHVYNQARAAIAKAEGGAK